MNLSDSIEAWKVYYDMTDDQCGLLELLFFRKISNPNQIISLSKREISLIGTDDEEGLNESETSFKEMSFVWEK